MGGLKPVPFTVRGHDRGKARKLVIMNKAVVSSPALTFLEDRWDPKVAKTLDEPELLRYRSNLLGSDLRITNFAGGNTSSKIAEMDPLTGEPVEVLWVKGSGGDLGSIKRTGFATLYQQKLLALERSYKGAEREDEMADLYPLCAFRGNPVAASIDTPLHGFLPFPHVDHLHPDWGIALAASANGKVKMEEFNREFGHSLVWLPWQLQSTRRCTGFFRSRTWTICIPTGALPWPHQPTAKPRCRSSTASSVIPWSGCPGSAPALSWP